ncbi:MAG: hypothetical protein ACRENN_06105 [Candidatus Eiseniibacteriota bacterium]
MISRRPFVHSLVAGFLWIAIGAVPSAWAGTAPDPIERLCEYGITLALTGREAASESVFISMLSRVPRDARALNNLGNLSLWRSDPGVALAFYAQAQDRDSTDAGIMLNEATALMLAGEDDIARERAGEAVDLAGGPEAASSLLGLRVAELDADAARGSDRPQLSRDEVLALLRAAVRAVPADSTHSKPASGQGAGTKKGKPLPAWRSAGARGASEADASPVVYWKR